MTRIRRPLDAVQPADDRRIDLASFPKPPAWTEQALCAQTDPALFFPDKGGSVAAAKAICGTCPVEAKCLEYALTSSTLAGYPVAGVWGGTSGLDRRRLGPPKICRRECCDVEISPEIRRPPAYCSDVCRVAARGERRAS